MKSVAAIIIMPLIIIFISCTTAPGTVSVCAGSSQQAFDSLKSAVERKDSKALLNIYDLGVMHIPDTIFANLQNPTIQIIPGEFGIQHQSNADKYLTNIYENGNLHSSKVIIIQISGGCYQVTNIAEIKP